MEFSVRVCLRFLHVVRRLRLQSNLTAWNRPVLRIVHDPSHGSENRGKSRSSQATDNAANACKTLRINFSLLVEWFQRGCEAAERVSKRAWRASSPLEDCESESRREEKAV